MTLGVFLTSGLWSTVFLFLPFLFGCGASLLFFLPCGTHESSGYCALGILPRSSRAAIVASMGRVDTWEGVFCVHLVRRLWSRFIIPFPKCPRISSIWDFAVTPLPPDSPVGSAGGRCWSLSCLWVSGTLGVGCPVCAQQRYVSLINSLQRSCVPKCVIFSTNYRLTYPSYVAPHPG